MSGSSDSNMAKRVTRRDFLKRSAAASAAILASRASLAGAFAAGSDTIRVGLIGCGGRGTGAAGDCVKASPGVEIVALGDLFEDRLRGAREKLQELGDRMKVTDAKCFVGFDAYARVIDSGVDLVILAAPPHFRPRHLAAAVEAGKHVFMEKPVAVDPVGARSVIASAERAVAAGLAIVAGTQRRHDAAYVETMKRIQGGAIGDLVAGQCYWNQGGLWVRRREPGWSDMEWQARNWLYFTWLSGDHIVEQHVHNIDVMNWAFGGPPVKAMGLGGRQVRTGPEYGNVYDHFAVEFEYGNGARVMSTCRQIDGTSDRVWEHLVGTKGTAAPSGTIWGENAYKFEGEVRDPYAQEHVDLIAGIRSGQPLNEARQVAESTLTAIMGRISAYTGREVSWEWVMNASKLRLGPEAYEFGHLPVEPVAMPGQTKLM